MDRSHAVEPSVAAWNGRVVDVRGRTAIVRIDRDACGSCPSAAFCGTGGGGDEPPIEAMNGAGADKGDRVAVDVRPSSRLIAGVLVFLVPVVAAIGGAAAGALFGPSFFGFEADIGAATGFLGGLVVAFGGLAVLRPRVEASRRFVPVVVQVLSEKGSADTVSVCPGRGLDVAPEPARSSGS